MECAQLDIIQCYEQLEYFGIDRKKEFRELHQKYLNELLKAFENKITQEYWRISRISV